MTTPTQVTVESLNSLHDLVPLVRKLRAARSEVLLDFSALAGSRSVRIDIDAVASLANVLMTDRGKVVLSVRLPAEEALQRQLARGGLLFALAQRTGHTILELSSNEDKAPLFESESRLASLETWAGTWSPSELEFRQRLYSEGLGTRRSGPTALIQDAFVLFKNPLQAVPRDRLAKEITDNVTEPWLAQILQVIAPSVDETWAASFVGATGAVVNELLYNLAVHPFASILRVPDVPKESRQSYVALFATRGGGKKSFDRLHVVVADCGHGIPRTLRYKLRQLGSELAHEAADELLNRLLRQELPEYGRAEGYGLGRVLELAINYGGSVHILTGADDEWAGTIYGQVLRGSGSEPAPTVQRYAALESRGTIVHAVLALEPMSRQPEQDLLELGAVSAR